MEVLDDTAAVLDEMFRLELAVFHHAAAQVSEAHRTQDAQTDKGKGDEQSHARGNAQIIKTHGGSAPQFRLSSGRLTGHRLMPVFMVFPLFTEGCFIS